MGRQAFISLTEVLRNHPDIGKYRDEVGVAVPAGDDMKMEMAFHPGPGDDPQVEAHVEAVGVHDPLQNGQGLPDLGQ